MSFAQHLVLEKWWASFPRPLGWDLTRFRASDNCASQLTAPLLPLPASHGCEDRGVTRPSRLSPSLGGKDARCALSAPAGPAGDGRGPASPSSEPSQPLGRRVISHPFPTVLALTPTPSISFSAPGNGTSWNLPEYSLVTLLFLLGLEEGMSRLHKQTPSHAPLLLPVPAHPLSCLPSVPSKLSSPWNLAWALYPPREPCAALPEMSTVTSSRVTWTSYQNTDSLASFPHAETEWGGGWESG